MRAMGVPIDRLKSQLTQVSNFFSFNYFFISKNKMIKVSYNVRYNRTGEIYLTAFSCQFLFSYVSLNIDKY